jgi:hypothetical protein
MDNTKHTQTNHFAVKFNFVRDLYIKQQVVLLHVLSLDKPVGALTKARGPTMHNRVVELLRTSRV